MQVFVQTLVGGLGFGAIYALVAMGFSIVYRTMGLVNFAHGDIVMIGAFIAETTNMTFGALSITSRSGWHGSLVPTLKFTTWAPAFTA